MSKSHANVVRDGEVFIRMTGSEKNRTVYEKFPVCGDGLCLLFFFLNKVTGLKKNVDLTQDCGRNAMVFWREQDTLDTLGPGRIIDQFLIWLF